MRLMVIKKVLTKPNYPTTIATFISKSTVISKTIVDNP